MHPKAYHRSHRGLNNRVENVHQPTRLKEKTLIKVKSPGGAQKTIALMGKVRNILAVEVGRYRKTTEEYATAKSKFGRSFLKAKGFLLLKI